MGLNIVAERKLSLKDFAEGWDGCYLVIRAASDTQRRKWNADMVAKTTGDSKKDEEVATNAIREACHEAIKRGVVMSTDKDGNAKAVSFGREDVPTVVDALNFAWQQEVVAVATGSDRLKG